MITNMNLTLVRLADANSGILTADASAGLHAIESTSQPFQPCIVKTRICDFAGKRKGALFVSSTTPSYGASDMERNDDNTDASSSSSKLRSVSEM
jgi:hypothetical protein